MAAAQTLLALLLLAATSAAQQTAGKGRERRERKEDREGRLLGLFSIVRFPNTGCIASSTENGTCLTLGT